MKKTNILNRLMLSLLILSLAVTANAQQTRQAAAFHGAKAVKDEYKAVYQLNSGNDKVIRATLRNMKNALQDPRLKGRLKLELVAHSGGIVAFLKKNDYGPSWKSWLNRVLFWPHAKTPCGKDILINRNYGPLCLLCQAVMAN